MKVCCFSDMHGHFPKVEPCDLVLICGDNVPLECQGSTKETKKWYINEFKPWAESLDCNKVLFIAGNHELHFRKSIAWVQENFGINNKVTYLEEDLYIYVQDNKEYKIYGTPYCKKFGNWAFMESNDELTLRYKNIPKDLDILMTHDQPYGTNDIILDKRVYWASDKHIGNIPLREAILEKQPKYSFGGHLHSGSHSFSLIKKTKVNNVSLLDELYNMAYEPFYLDL